MKKKHGKPNFSIENRNTILSIIVFISNAKVSDTSISIAILTLSNACFYVSSAYTAFS